MECEEGDKRLYKITTYAYRRYVRLMERISCTEDEDDLLRLYAAVIQVMFNDRVADADIDQLDISEIVDTFKQIADIVDRAVNEKVRNISILLGGQPEENQGSIFDEYDLENGYVEETTQEDIWRSYETSIDAILQICINDMHNSYKECLDSDVSDLLDYVMYQVEYNKQK